MLRWTPSYTLAPPARYQEGSPRFRPEVGSGFHKALLEGNVESVEKTLTEEPRFIDTRFNGKTMIYIAAENGHDLLVERLIQLGSKEIDSTCFGHTPLYAAADGGHPSVIEVLVRMGSKAIDTQSRCGETPLHTASIMGHTSVIETLVRLGSQAIDVPNKMGTAPLGSASMLSRESTKTLVFLGADHSQLNHLHKVCSTVKRLESGEHEQEVVDTRYRVYFAHSLVRRLLFELERSFNSSLSKI